MLKMIQQVIGGYVRIDQKQLFVLWVVNNKKEIESILKIFDKYPLLCSRKICQLNFLLSCFENPCVENYLKTRNNKYKDQQIIIQSNPYKSLNNPYYFEKWLSGFVEAEGCFSIRKSGQTSFSIGQKYEHYIIHAIQQYFNSSNTLRQPSNHFFLLEIYNQKTLHLILNHFDKNPLLGHKKISFQKFKKASL